MAPWRDGWIRVSVSLPIGEQAGRPRPQETPLQAGEALCFQVNQVTYFAARMMAVSRDRRNEHPCFTEMTVESSGLWRRNMPFFLLRFHFLQVKLSLT